MDKKVIGFSNEANVKKYEKIFGKAIIFAGLTCIELARAANVYTNNINWYTNTTESDVINKVEKIITDKTKGEA